MSRHVYVEIKRRSYLIAAAVVVSGDLDPVRKLLRGFILPGQRRLHMKDENDSRKRAIASAVATSGITASIYDAGRFDRKTAVTPTVAVVTHSSTRRYG